MKFIRIQAEQLKDQEQQWPRRNNVLTKGAKAIVTGLLAAIFFAVGFGICFSGQGLLAENLVPQDSVTQDSVTDPEFSLLLNSGTVEIEEAELSILIWFEDGYIPPVVWGNRPIPDWEWTYHQTQAEDGHTVAMLSTRGEINCEQEKIVSRWYVLMSQELADSGGLIYLDERLEAAVDIYGYLGSTQASLIQSVSLDNLLSVTAYQHSIPSSLKVGENMINLQLLSRGKSDVGKTVLAIPALLKEF